MMQTDVKSQHGGVSGVMVSGRTRLKGVIMFPFSGSTEYTVIVDDISVSGTYARATTTATITATNHGLKVGDWVYLDWGLTNNPYQVQTVADANTFTVTVTNNGATSGSVTVWNDVLLQLDASDPSVYSVQIPGEGVLAHYGIRLFLGDNTHITVFYG